MIITSIAIATFSTALLGLSLIGLSLFLYYEIEAPQEAWFMLGGAFIAGGLRQFSYFFKDY